MQRKFNVPVTVALVRAGLINIVEQDSQLAVSILRDFRVSTINFTASFVRECLLQDPPSVSRTQLGHSIEALGRAAQVGKATET